MGQRSFDPDAVQRELGKLQRTPPTSTEQIASRALVRFARASKEGDDEHAIRATEEWVRLYIALRRAGGTGVERLSAETLRKWHTRVCRQASLKRKCFLVPKAELAALPEYPLTSTGLLSQRARWTCRQISTSRISSLWTMGSIGPS